MLDYWRRKFWDGERSLAQLVSGVEPTRDEQRLLFRNNVETVNLELSSRCNRKCNYCPVASSDRRVSQKIIDRSLLDVVLDGLRSIGYAGTVSLNLYNEPLLNPQLAEQLGRIRASLPKAYLSFNSNGDALNVRRLRELVAAGLNALCVTLHPRPYERLSPEDILDRLTRLLGKLDHRLEDDVDLADVIATRTRLSFRCQGADISVQWPDWNTLGGSRGGEVVALDFGKPVRTQPCVRPFREFTIYHDGTVTPCCEVFYDGTKRQNVVGRIGTEPGAHDIFSLYASGRLNAFRRSVFDYSDKFGVCKHCPVTDYADGGDAATRTAILEDSAGAATGRRRAG